MTEWLVAETQRHRETVARAHLARAGLTTYLPLLRQWPRPAVGPEVAPLFPGYVFVHTARERRHAIERTPGVRGLVAFGGEAARLDDAVIDFLRAREDGDGIVGVTPRHSGAAVRIAAGPLEGLDAIFERRLPGRDRVLVLLEILQRQTRVELPETWVRFA